MINEESNGKYDDVLDDLEYNWASNKEWNNFFKGKEVKLRWKNCSRKSLSGILCLPKITLVVGCQVVSNGEWST